MLFQQGATLDASREDMGIITVSQSISTLGIIESANSMALAMFGYNKRDMVGQVCVCGTKYQSLLTTLEYMSLCLGSEPSEPSDTQVELGFHAALCPSMTLGV